MKNDNTRDRLLLPLAIPLGSFAFIGLIVWGVSRILLHVPHQVATAIAIGASANILIVAAMFSSRKRFTQTQFFALTGTAILPLALGGAVAVGIIQVEGGEHEGPEIFRVNIAAENLVFDKVSFEAPSSEFVIAFANKDPGIPHNISIFKGENAQGTNVFKGDLFPGVKTMEYSIPSLEPGNYFFHCDVHQQMTGTMTVEAHEGEESSAEHATSEEEVKPTVPVAQSDSAEVVAKNVVFVQKSLEFASGTPIMLAFKNEDAGIPHNISIFKGSSASGSAVFRGEVFAGPKTITYNVPALQSGSYFFHCDVHPNMTGTIKVG